MSCEKTIVLEPCSCTWGVEQVRSWEMTELPVSGDYALLNTPSTNYYVYVGTDPVIAGATGIELVAGADIAATLVALKAALDALTNKFYSEIDGSKICISNIETGAVDTESDSGLVTIETIKVGLGGDLGKTSEDGAELSMKTTKVEIKTAQDGDIIVDEVIIGVNASISMSLVEMTYDRWQTIVGSVVGDYDGTLKIVGLGKSKLYKNISNYAGRLVMHPIRMGADKSRDITLFLCAPTPESINFNNEKQAMAVTFVSYPDDRVNEKFNLVAFGDSSQDVQA